MKKLRFAVFGTGFWANYQIAAWNEVGGVELVALYNRTKAKATAMAEKFNVSAVYDDYERLLDKEQLDFADIITDVDSHAAITEAVAKRGIPVICQKPMAPKLPLAQRMVDVCREHNVPFFVHENWRWQAPMRKLKTLLNEKRIGEVFKSRVTFCSAFPVFDNQPFLAELDEFILTDIGSHILDACRFLFGDAETLYCNVATVNSKIKGEDVANVMMRMKDGSTCYAEMSYASIMERESFPQTYVLIEGSGGSIRLQHDYVIKVTTRDGTETLIARPPQYAWADPKYALVHASIVECNRDILQSLQSSQGKGSHNAETIGTDNLETVRLVHAAYASARSNSMIRLSSFK
ncbi:Gfo/Idh/MocA family oxidoreductase [Chryseolinea sp. T2]|uniref:Gfo/Idh/MocA family protein n=1 Tax=Chryseolinea sp. T2 TaxID=3129255 RepID=UPI0030769D35